MKISEILARDPIAEYTGWSEVEYRLGTWKNIFPFDTYLEFGYPEPDLSEWDISLKTYWADASQHMYLNCIFIDSIPVVLYETIDSWDGNGQVWPLNGEMYMELYDAVKKIHEVELYTFDTDIQSDYIGIETPDAGWY